MNFIRPLFLLLLSAASLRAGELDSFLADPEMWNSSAGELAGKYGELKFSWSSTDHSVARLLEKNRLFDEPLSEVTFAMRDEKPAEVNVVFYDRGDSGELARELMATLVSNVQRRTAAWMGTKPTALNDQLKTTGVKREGMLWTNTKLETRLTWAYSTKDAGGKFGFRAEYVKMHVAPLGTKAATPQLAGGTVSAGALKAKLKREANGDVVLSGVPMVDQGEKGYCAVASAERVMRFYGMNVDQHELAQLASSSAEVGTDPGAMLDSLRRVGIKLGCKVRSIEDFSVQELLRMIERYNAAAKKKKLPQIHVGNVIDLADVYDQMDTEILRDIRTKSAGGVKSFLGNISKNVEAATPLLWSVQLGKVDEKPMLPKQAKGGHMRLIIGYNPKTSELLYTDSWGPGHELKRMALDDAWTITCALSVIEPRRTTQ